MGLANDSCMFLWLFCISVVQFLAAGENTNSKGRAFMLSFLKNFDSSSHNGLLITTDKATTVFINDPSTVSLTRHFVEANSSFYTKLPYETTASRWGIPEKIAVSVYSIEPVSVYGITAQPRSTGAYMAIPIDKWGDHYVVATYDGSEGSGGEIAVIGGEDGTSLSIRLNVIKTTTCIVRHRVVEYSTLLAFTLGREEVLRMACNDDLTGSVIKSSSPVGVITGNSCVQVPFGTPYCDHLVEMMIPVSMLGQEYILMSPVKRQSRFRVIYTDTSGPEAKDMDVYYEGKPGEEKKITNLFKEISIEPNTVVKLNTSLPTLVVLYSVGFNDSQAYGDPSMSIVVPVERWDSEFNLNFNWTSLLATDVHIHLGITAPDNGTLAIDGVQMDTVEAYGLKNVQANVTDTHFISKDSFIPGSNIIVVASSIGSSAAFPVGMKMDFFTGVDNCENSPCLHEGICYSHGNNIMCYCGDQLDGLRCEIDIFNGCASNPCLNDGFCVDLAIDFECICAINFTGKRCESEVEITTTTMPPTTTTAATIPVTTARPTTATTTSTSTSTTTPSSTTTTTSTTATKPETTTGITIQRRKCPCSCDNVTTEVIEKEQEEIKKELEVDVKTTHKTKTKFTSTYDARTSAKSIGIFGVVFLSVLFGSIVLLDAFTAFSYISTRVAGWYRRRLPNKDVKIPLKEDLIPDPLTINEATVSYCPTFLPWSAKTAHVQNNVSPFSKTSVSDKTTVSRSCVFMPRFQVNDDKLIAVGQDGEAFKMRKPSWTLKKKMARWHSDSISINSQDETIAYPRKLSRHESLSSFI